MPQDEGCNGFDDDCDGSVDEALYQLCDENAEEGVGECRPSARLCSDGMFGECSPPIEPSEDICDGKDNDCDGSVDETYPDGDMDNIADCVDLDLDNDGRTNTLDNCPLIANDGQRDTDGDDVGDACDDDDDGDGFLDVDDCGPLSIERFPAHLNCVTALMMIATAQSMKRFKSPALMTTKRYLVWALASKVYGPVRRASGQRINQVLPTDEACNGQDDDCDGLTDEGFEAGFPDVDVDGFGDQTAAPVCPAPDGYVLNRLDCDDGNADIKPGAEDRPDPLYLDSNCDGTDGDAEAMEELDVGGEGERDQIDGSRENPYQTMLDAKRALEREDKKYLAIRINAVPLNFTLLDGVNLIGGYGLDENWTRSDEIRTRLIKAAVDPDANLGLYAESFEQPIEIMDIDIEVGGSREFDTTNYGVFFKDMASVTLRNVAIQVGDGAPGSAGIIGMTGDAGVNGAGGGSCTPDGGNGRGGNSAAAVCGDNGYPGGDGGRGYDSDGSDGLPQECGGGGGDYGGGFDSGDDGGAGGSHVTVELKPRRTCNGAARDSRRLVYR